MEDLQPWAQIPRRALPDLLEEEKVVFPGIAVLPAIFAALILRTDRRIIATLRAAKATSTSAAIPLDAGTPLTRWRLERLIRKGAVQTTGTDRYYINEIAWRIYRSKRRRRAITMVLILVPLTLLLVWWTSGEAAVG